MSFLAKHLFGVSMWIWLYFLFSIFAGLGVAIYFYRERLKKKYYEMRFPEKLLKVVIHYKSGMFKEYWRIIPDGASFILEGKEYQYSNKNVMRTSDFFIKNSDKKHYVEILGKKYEIHDLLKIKKRFSNYPEIHYFFNVPSPISFDMKNKKIDFSAKQLQEFKENDLFAKLLTLDTEKQIQMIILACVVINALISIVILSKMMGWLK